MFLRNHISTGLDRFLKESEFSYGLTNSLNFSITNPLMPQSPVKPSVGTVLAWRDCSGQYDGQSDPLTSVLQQRGYDVIAINHENDVLQAVLKSVPDLLIIYLQASGEQGYEFCRALRKLSCTSTLPVVFVGTRNQACELVSALRCGGNEYLQLPIDEEACGLRLERLLKTVRLVRGLEADRASLQQQIWTHNRLFRQQRATQISLAKENQALQQMAFTDALTQVANRRSFNEKLPRLWQEAKERNQPISLLLCDIDYFKRYNDTYGHLRGDVCLQAVAEALVKGTHRHGDQVARYGGEEFAILLPATDSQGAQQVALAVQSAIAKAQMPHASSPTGPYVSLSIGICTLEPARYPASYANSSQQDYEVLVYAADEALYTAKLRGRDRAVINSPNGLITVLPSRPCGNFSSAALLPTAKNASIKMPVNKSPQALTRPLLNKLPKLDLKASVALPLNVSLDV